MQSQPAARGRPGTPSLLRVLNDRAALDLLLGGEMLTRAQISEYTGVSKVTVSQMLARLEERGLVAIAAGVFLSLTAGSPSGEPGGLGR